MRHDGESLSQYRHVKKRPGFAGARRALGGIEGGPGFAGARRVGGLAGHVGAPQLIAE